MCKHDAIISTSNTLRVQCTPASIEKAFTTAVTDTTTNKSFCANFLSLKLQKLELIALIRDDVTRIVGDPQSPWSQANNIRLHAWWLPPMLVHVNLIKEDVPLTKIDLDCIDGYNNTQLKRWLHCMGLAVSGNWAECIKKCMCGVPGVSVLFVFCLSEKEHRWQNISCRKHAIDTPCTAQILAAEWRMILLVTYFCFTLSQCC